jgi:hypothetical protein
VARCENGSGRDHTFDQDGRCATCGLTWAETVRGFGSNVAPRKGKPRTLKSLSG